MEGGLFLLGILLVVGLPVGAILGIIAFFTGRDLVRQVDELKKELAILRKQREGIRGFGAPAPTRQQDAAPPASAPLPSAPSAPPLAPAFVPPPDTGVAAARGARSSLLVDVPQRRAQPPVPPVSSPPAAPVVVYEPLPGSVPAAPVTAAPLPAAASVSSVAVSTPMVAPPMASSSVPVAANTAGPATSSAARPAAPSAGPAADPASVTSFEAVVGKRWLTWSGVALLFLGGVFLLKYAYDQDWLGRFITPPMRIGGIAVAAVVMLLIGLRFLRQGLTALGQGLAGGAIAMGYLAVYGGFSPSVMLVPEPLFPGKLAFALMAFVTAVGMTLAVRAQALPMAVCAILGGFATPVLIDTGGGSREALFTYVLMLDLSVLAAAWYRRWRALDTLAFVGTVLLYSGWYLTREAPAPEPWGLLLWLMVFHLVFLVLPFAHHWRTRSTVTVERFALAVGNLAFTLGFAALLLRDQHATALALVCLGLAALYGGIGMFTRARIGEDAKVVHGFLALGVMLLTLGLFYLLPVEAIATAWVAEAVTLLALGYRYAHAPTRVLAHVVLALALVRLVLKTFPPPDLSAALVFNAWVPALLVAPLGLGAAAAVHRWFGSTQSDRRWQTACWWLAGAALLLVGSAELARHALGHPTAWAELPQASVQGVWWMLGALGFLAGAWRWRCTATAHLALLPALLGVVLVFAAYAKPWPGGGVAFNPRCLLTFTTLAGLALWWWSARRGSARLGDTAALQPLVLVLVQLGLVLLATLETIAWHVRLQPQAPAPGDLHRMLTVVWLVAALCGTLVGAAVRLRLIAQVALLPLCVGVVAAFLLYSRDGAAVPLMANARFLVVLLAVVVVAVQRLVYREFDWWASLVQVLATAAVVCEVLRWSHDHLSGEAAMSRGTWSLSLTLAGSALIAVLRWRRGATAEAWWMGAMLAGSAILPALMCYLFIWETWQPFLNLRVLAPVGVLLALVVAARVVVVRPLPEDPGRPVFLCWYATLFGFAFCTMEAPAHYLQTVGDPALAKRLATFSVTVVWVVLAVGALIVGFRWQQRLVRYLALGLFALTAAKLLVIDMNGVQQLYRILAFMLVGVVLIAASYAYHRLERRLIGNTPPES
ncbi:MAG: DUF2339 domain-containing protein [Planctomycetes bacterium]|nr:DUF2339 domain-containing protein [Planctomycetota bacterium]